MIVRLLFLLLSISCTSAAAQTIARPRHPDPLARPTPLTTVRTCDPDALLRTMQTVLRADTFAVTRFDEGDYVIEAEKASIDDRGPGVDRVILWLERDLARPMQAVRAFLSYGRFDRIFGEAAPVRVQVTRDYELRRTRGIRDSLMSYTPPPANCQ